jgi:hypothetical protein
VYALATLSILAIVMLSLLAYEIAGRRPAAGFIVAALLAVNPMHAFLSRFPVSENVTVFFAATAFYYLVRSFKSGGSVLALTFSAGAWACVFFTHIAGFLYAPIVAAVILAGAAGARDRRTLLQMLGYGLAVLGAFALSLWYGTTWAFPYSYQTYRQVFGQSLGELILYEWPALTVATGIGGTLLVFATWHFRERIRGIARSARLQRGLIALLLLVTLAAFFDSLLGGYQLGFTPDYVWQAEHRDSRWAPYAEQGRLTWNNLVAQWANQGLAGFFHSSAAALVLYVSPFILLAGLALLALRRGRLDPFETALACAITLFVAVRIGLTGGLTLYYYSGRYLAGELVPYLIVFGGAGHLRAVAGGWHAPGCGSGAPGWRVALGGDCAGPAVPGGRDEPAGCEHALPGRKARRGRPAAPFRHQAARAADLARSLLRPACDRSRHPEPAAGGSPVRADRGGYLRAERPGNRRPALRGDGDAGSECLREARLLRRVADERFVRGHALLPVPRGPAGPRAAARGRCHQLRPRGPGRGVPRRRMERPGRGDALDRRPVGDAEVAVREIDAGDGSQLRGALAQLRRGAGAGQRRAARAWKFHDCNKYLTQSLPIKPEDVRLGTVTVSFEMPNVKSPQDLDADNPDRRKLGLSVRRVVVGNLLPAQPVSAELRTGDAVRFDRRGNADQYLGTGWSGQEEDMRWTDGKLALLQLPFAEGITAATLTFEALSYNCIDVGVSVNDQLRKRWTFTDCGAYVTQTITLGREDLRQGTVTIAFATPNAKSPQELNPAIPDRRKLGISVRKLTVDPPSARETP